MLLTKIELDKILTVNGNNGYAFRNIKKKENQRKTYLANISTFHEEYSMHIYVCIP